MATTITTALRALLPSKLPPSLSTNPANLYQVLSRYPHDGVGRKVFQTRWGYKGIEGCYWEVTRTRLKLEGNHGKAWGYLVWRGMSGREASTTSELTDWLFFACMIFRETG